MSLDWIGFSLWNWIGLGSVFGLSYASGLGFVFELDWIEFCLWIGLIFDLDWVHLWIGLNWIRLH